MMAEEDEERVKEHEEHERDDECEFRFQLDVIGASHLTLLQTCGLTHPSSLRPALLPIRLR